MTQPRFSVVIPACDRPNYLEHTLRACLESEFTSFEVIVSDNFSKPEVSEVVKRFSGDARLRYVRTDRRLSCTDHWNFAWQHSKAPYVIMVGDDDGVAPKMLGIIDEVIRRWNPRLVSWGVGIYFHPGWRRDFGENVYRFTENRSGLVLKPNLDQLIQNYGNFDRTYFPEGGCMCFERSLGEQVQRETGRLYWPLALDLTAPLFFLGILKKGDYLYIDSCINYHGRSVDSNVAAYEEPQEGVDCVKRATDFFDEHGAEDVCPHHPYKSRAYFNAHPQALNLAKALFPERFKNFSVNQVMFLTKIRAELLGISNYNPFLDEGDVRRLEEYALEFSDEIHRASHTELMKILLKSPKDAKILKRLEHMDGVRGAVWKQRGVSRETFDLKAAYKLMLSQEPSNAEESRQASPAELLQTHPQSNVLRDKGHLNVICSRVNCHNSYELSKIHYPLIQSLSLYSTAFLDSWFKQGLLDEALRL